MKNKLANIVGIYGHNRPFVFSLGLFVGSATVSKILFHQKHVYYGEEVLTILFVVSLWLAFHLGILIKWQFATHRASLLPNYRRWHVMAAMGLFGLCCLIGSAWQLGFHLVIQGASHSFSAINITCICIAFLVMYLGYLSISRLLMYGYLGLLIFSSQAAALVLRLEDSSFWVNAMAIICLLLMATFVQRLLQLKESHFEYPYLLSWPLRKFIGVEVKPGRYSFGLQKYRHITHPLARALHWDPTVRSEGRNLLWLLGAVVVLVALVGRQIYVEMWSDPVYNNFLVLSLTPVLMTAVARYPRLAYWGYDVVKPVSKLEYFKEQAAVSLVLLVIYWAFFSVCFGVVPAAMMQSELLLTGSFWFFLLFALNFSVLVFFNVAILACTRGSVFVLVQGAFLALASLTFFYFAPAFAHQWLVCNGVCLVANIITGRIALSVWCKQDFK